MKKWKKLLGWMVGLAILVGIGAVFYLSYQLGYRAFSNESQAIKEDVKVTFEVKEGTGQKEVADQLVEKGLLESPFPFMVRYTLSEYRGKIQPGSYELDGTMGIDDILVILTQTESTK